MLRGGLLFLLVCFGACIPVGGFDGDIDGDAVPAQLTGLYGTAESGGASLSQIIGLSFWVPCDRYTQWAEDRSDIISDFAKSDHSDDDVDDAVSDLEQTDDEFGLPEEWWSVTISVIDDDDLEDNDFDAFGEKNALVGVGIAHQTERADYEKLLKKGVDPNVDSFIAIDGKLTLEDVVDETSLRVTTDELDFADAEDVFEDGEDAKTVGTGTLTLSAAHCADFSDALDKALEDLGVDDPPAGEGEGEGGFCFIGSDCPNIACLCDDGSAVGRPINSSICTNEQCESAFQLCPTTCDDFGLPWTGLVVDTTEPPPDEPDSGQTGSCGSFLGGGDGCDCGCGTFDTDCESTAADVCEFNQCVTGEPETFDNASCRES